MNEKMTITILNPAFMARGLEWVSLKAGQDSFSEAAVRGNVFFMEIDFRGV